MRDVVAKKSDLEFVKLTDPSAIEKNKQLVLRKGERVGYVFAKEGAWAGYVHRRADILGAGSSREKAFLDAEKKLQDEDPASRIAPV